MSDENENGNAGAEGTQAQENAGASKGAGDEFSLLDAATDQPKPGERPEWLPEAAWDAETKAAKPDVLLTEYERAAKIAKDLRAKLGKGEQKPPAKAEDYKLPEFKDDADKGVADLLKADDPFIKGLTGIAHKSGLSQVQFEGFIGEAAKMLAAEIAKNGGDVQTAELTQEDKDQIRDREFAKIGPNAAQMVSAVGAHLKMLQEQGHFNDGEMVELRAMAATAEGITVLNKMRVLMGGESIPLGDSVTVDGLPSDREIAGVMSSKAYMESSDPDHAATHKKVDAWLSSRRKAGRPETLQF